MTPVKTIFQAKYGNAFNWKAFYWYVFFGLFWCRDAWKK